MVRQVGRLFNNKVGNIKKCALITYYLVVVVAVVVGVVAAAAAAVVIVTPKIVSLTED